MQLRPTPQLPQQQDAPPPAADSNSVKLVTELKPDTLSHDASAGELHIWCRKYEVYYHASNMQLARNQVQQAYLLNCLDFRALFASDQRDRSYNACARGRRVMLDYAHEHFSAEVSLAAEKKNFFWHGAAVRPRPACFP